MELQPFEVKFCAKAETRHFSIELGGGSFLFCFFSFLILICFDDIIFSTYGCLEEFCLVRQSLKMAQCSLSSIEFSFDVFWILAFYFYNGYKNQNPIRVLKIQASCCKFSNGENFSLALIAFCLPLVVLRL